MAETILEVKDLHYNYPDGTQAIKGIDFKVEEGQMISILGPNGAGKVLFSYILMELLNLHLEKLSLREKN